MSPSQFPLASSLLAPPDGMADQVEALPVVRGVSGGLPVVVSCWQLSEDERAAIAAGKPVFLHVVGGTMPPVLLSVGAPHLDTAATGQN